MKQIIITILIFASLVSKGNNAGDFLYWIQLNTKANSTFQLSSPHEFLSDRAIERRLRMNIAIDSTDLPVNSWFIDSLNNLGFKVKHTSRWMNGAIAYLPDSINIDSVFQPSFVAFYEIRKDARLKSSLNKFSDVDSLSESLYGNSFNQIAMLNGHILHQHSKGENVHIAVIDAGFKDADILPAFDSLHLRNGILGTFDFVTPGNNVYREHYHGAAVLSLMAGNIPGSLIGSAPMANYWLLRTEDDGSEFPIEEDYWIIAAEFADSAGCDVINTSLGYTTFDNPAFDHAYDQLDGNTLRVSKAANKAVEKGMVLAISAGNSGNDPWYYISAPSDAQNVLSVAAVSSAREIAGFSSRGFDNENPVRKPDIAAQGVGNTISIYPNNLSTGSGTSFSSPIIAGMAACLVDLFPEKNATEIIALIKSLGHLYPEHDLAYGYGIPDFNLLFSDNNSIDLTELQPQVEIYPNPFESNLNIKHLPTVKQIEIFNFKGERIFSKQLSTTGFSEILPSELPNLPKGVYFAVLKGTQSVQSFKLIKY